MIAKGNWLCQVAQIKMLPADLILLIPVLAHRGMGNCWSEGRVSCPMTERLVIQILLHPSLFLLWQDT